MIKEAGIRTDLALEVRESFPEDHIEISGVILEEDIDEESKIKVTKVIIQDEKGEQAMQKPMGTYITIESELLTNQDPKIEKMIHNLILNYLKELLGEVGENVLLVGLGNRNITADALGPLVVEQVLVTRHFIREFGADWNGRKIQCALSAVSPGVMAQTGMEAQEILKGIIHEIKPEKLIVIDALAARSINRLNTTIQLSDTGICPGAGIGNNRRALNKDSLGVDVIALGVPTVVDAATIVRDSMEQILTKQGFEKEDIGVFLTGLHGHGMEQVYVTPKNMDECVSRISKIIAEAINACFGGIL